tara:strand:- start:230 stop:877 length:648 start_codon:yes stop_codon:yes gene_type:complete
MTAKISGDGSIFLTERASAETDAAGNIQIWNKNTAGGQLYVTDDLGADQPIYTATTLPTSQYQTVMGTPAATTSGASIDFTGIPSGVKEVKVLLNGVSTNGTSLICVQIGDSGGIEASGYLSGAFRHDTAATATAGFISSATTLAANFYDAVFTLALQSSSSNTWVNESGMYCDGDTFTGSGAKDLSAELTQIRLTTVGGSNTFDAGSVNIQHSF